MYHDARAHKKKIFYTGNPFCEAYACYSKTMIFRHEYRGGVWVDLEQPTEEEIRQIAQEFGISERIEKEVLSPTPVPLVAVEGDMTLLILHFPAHGEDDGEDDNQEVDFIIGTKFIVTVRYEIVAPLYHLKKLLETRELVDGKDQMTTDMLIEILFAHLYASVRDHTNHIAGRLDKLERDMFDGHERNTIRSISNVSREFLHIEAALANQEEPLSRFLKLLSTEKGFGDAFAERAERMLAERVQVAHLIKTYRAVATELRETNLALVESRQNEIMKMFTVITFIFLPMELITFVFGMHALGTPLEQNPNAFWIITGTMVTIGLLVSLFVARKRWLA